MRTGRGQEEDRMRTERGQNVSPAELLIWLKSHALFPSSDSCIESLILGTPNTHMIQPLYTQHVHTTPTIHISSNTNTDLKHQLIFDFNLKLKSHKVNIVTHLKQLSVENPYKYKNK